MLLAAIAGISLLVGGIGIMNMMLTNVTERTREIGLRKAIGAKKNEISQQFLMESVVLTFIGGIIGIGYWEGAICSTDPRAAAKAMKHVRDLVGIQHVALGSDYDGATTVRFDTSQLAQVTQALMDEGFTPDEIRAVMGENALRVIRAGLVPMEKAAAAQ